MSVVFRFETAFCLGFHGGGRVSGAVEARAVLSGADAGAVDAEAIPAVVATAAVAARRVTARWGSLKPDVLGIVGIVGMVNSPSGRGTEAAE